MRYEIVFYVIALYMNAKSIVALFNVSHKSFLPILSRNFYTAKRSIMKSTVSSSLAATAALKFDNRNLRDLPVDKETRNFARQVPNAIFSRCQPTPVNSPDLIACSVDALKLLGLEISDDQKSASPDKLSDATRKMLEEYFSGNVLLPGSETSAHVYCGHQFGNFAGQLGDGAAIGLGEVMHKDKRWELQLKGAGLTPFSRTADGRKVLRSSIREFLCSEAMHFLHVPTTRAATLVTSKSTVQRDPFYDGNVLDEKCTVVSRTAPNFFRFGSFEIFKYDGGRKGPSAGNEELKRTLLDHVLTYYPEIDKNDSSEEQYAALYTEVVRRTAELVARWQTVGFVHGVLNTDNMSIMGLTVDYGPFAFEEYFDPDFTPNGSDGSARYTYDAQPSICKWNLNKLAEQLKPLLPIAHAKEILNTHYDDAYEQYYLSFMRNKMGLLSPQAGDKQLIEDYFNTMAKTQTDFTDSFQALISYADDRDASNQKEILLERLVSRSATPSDLTAMLRRKMKIQRLGMHPDQIQQLWSMLEKSPEEISSMFGGAPVDAIRAEIEGEMKKLEGQTKAAQTIQRLQTLSAKDKTTDDREMWRVWLDLYHTRLNAEIDSSEEKKRRIKVMRDSNPTFVLRNWIAEDAIQAAERGSYKEINVILEMLQTPFAPQFSTFVEDNDREDIIKKYTQTAPAGANSLICTCSS
mmetsp:Transcript_27404/g.26199  ORF Transcript_27404/g.26199 Transcript_27404/m.26199 type:complete len:691 (+) Transcript_27404:27-2099(+)